MMVSRSLLCLLSALLFFLSLAELGVTQSVAPGDADSYCLDQSGRVPTSNIEHILVDTQNYRSGALVTATGGNGIWLSVDFDEPNSSFYRRWYDNNQGIECKHYLLACGTDQSGQDNWLITQYINITDVGVKELTINVTFATDSTCTNCQQSYSISAFQTNEINETFRANSSAYYHTGVRLIHTAGQDRFSFRRGRFKITSTGLYLAVVDEGSCTAIQRLVVYYDICPYQVKNLVIYPRTVAPSISFSQDIDIVGSCIENASPVSANLQLACELNGVWDNVDVSCSCNPGYELSNNISCDVCSEGYFKSSQGHHLCEKCPENSNSTTSGTTSCTCLTGYYRSRYEDPTAACTAPPSSPMGLRNTSILSTSFNVTWTAPSDAGGRTDIFYIVTITGKSINIAVNITDTQHTFTGLNPSTTYTVSVRAGNGVSDQDSSNDVNRTVSITVTTPNSGPTKPLDVNLGTSQVTGVASILTWTAPANIYGTLQGYHILINTVNNSAEARVVITLPNTATRYDLDNLDIQPGTYYIWIRAINEYGPGELSTSFKYHQTEGPTNILPAVIGGTVGGISFLFAFGLVVLIVIIVVLCVITRRKKVVNVDVMNCSATNHSGELELTNIVNPLPPNPNRMYVDPRTYSSLNHAFEQSGVREIPPKEITSMDEIGIGEFGLVYKALWTLKGVPVAVKTLRGGATDGQRESFLFEASVMGQFNHPNVVKLYGIISRVDPVMIVMEYLEKGSLDRHLQRNLDKLGIPTLLKLAHGVASGMYYLSKIGFVHRDLAARNVLVAKDDTCKVADFGLARELVDNEYDVQKGGRIPVRWTAPEAISHRSFTTASDVWSYGVLLWEIMSYGETPYEGWDNYSIFQRLENGERLRQPQNCPDDVYQIMLDCWNAERSERPNFEELVNRMEILAYGKPLLKPKPRNLQSPNRVPPRPPPPGSHSVETIENLLHEIGMSRYIENFHKHELYNVSDCFGFTEDDLEKIGVSLGGHQYKIFKNLRIKEEELGRLSP